MPTGIPQKTTLERIGLTLCVTLRRHGAYHRFYRYKILYYWDYNSIHRLPYPSLGESQKMRIKQLLVATIFASVPLFAPVKAYASDTAALLAILEQAIMQLLQQQILTQTTEDGLGNVEEAVKSTEQTIKVESEANARAIMNGQVDIYNQQNQKDQQASTFCQEDQVLATQIGKAVTQKTYSRQTNMYNKYNSAEAIREPAKFTARHNRQVKENITPACDPRMLPPVGKKDLDNGSTPMSCTETQIELATAVASGRKPAPQPPESLKNTDVGEVLQQEIDTYNFRMSAVEAAIGSSISEEMDAQITAYQRLFASPTIEEINAMSGTGGISRDALVQQQIQNQLLLNIFKEMVETRRLLAIQVAQREEDHRKQIGALISNSGRQ